MGQVFKKVRGAPLRQWLCERSVELFGSRQLGPFQRECLFNGVTSFRASSVVLVPKTAHSGPRFVGAGGKTKLSFQKQPLF